MSKEIIKLIDKQVLRLQNMTTALEQRVPKWRDETIKLLSEHISNDELELFQSIDASTYEEDRKAFLEILNELKSELVEDPEEILIPDPLPKKNQKTGNPKKVFIVHGHDALARTEVARTIEKVGLEAIVLHEQPNEGKTIIEKFERDASQVGFAIALLTPDDVGHPINKPKEAKPRARQNVILELGYFSGILGRDKVLVLYKGDVEIPSDYLGVVYVPIDKSGAWKFNMAKELKQAGMKVDLNKLI